MIFKINNQKTSIQKGFMITEVLITVFLIVLTMVGILPILFGGIKSSKVAKVRAVMSTYGQKELESFNQNSFSGALGSIKKIMSDDIRFAKFIQNPPASISDSIYFLTPENKCIDLKSGTISDYRADCPKKIVIDKTYSYLAGGDTITDDVIKYSIKIRISGDTSKPVELNTIIARDKLEKA